MKPLRTTRIERPLVRPNQPQRSLANVFVFSLGLALLLAACGTSAQSSSGEIDSTGDGTEDGTGDDAGADGAESDANGDPDTEADADEETSVFDTSDTVALDGGEEPDGLDATESDVDADADTAPLPVVCEIEDPFVVRGGDRVFELQAQQCDTIAGTLRIMLMEDQSWIRQRRINRLEFVSSTISGLTLDEVGTLVFTALNTSALDFNISRITEEIRFEIVYRRPDLTQLYDMPNPPPRIVFDEVSVTSCAIDALRTAWQERGFDVEFEVGTICPTCEPCGRE